MSSCCAISEGSQTSPENCPSCGQPGRSVRRITLEALLTSAALRRGIPPAPRVCLTADCPVVYFDNAAALVFDASDLTISVYAKQPENPRAPVCYCFELTREMIEEETRRGGVRAVSGMIAAEVKAGHCACEVRNPKGTCCLGDVRHEERAAATLIAETMRR